MSDQSADKVVIIATHGPEDPERATLPFVMAIAAQAMETEAVLILQGNGVMLAGRNIHQHVYAGGLPPLRELMKTFLEGGGKLLVCTPCVQHRMLEEQWMVEGAELIAGARVIQEATSSSAVLNY